MKKSDKQARGEYAEACRILMYIEHALMRNDYHHNRKSLPLTISEAESVKRYLGVKVFGYQATHRDNNT